MTRRHAPPRWPSGCAAARPPARPAAAAASGSRAAGAARHRRAGRAASGVRTSTQRAVDALDAYDPARARSTWCSPRTPPTPSSPTPDAAGRRRPRRAVRPRARLGRRRPGAPDPDRPRRGRPLPRRPRPAGRGAVRLVPDVQLVPVLRHLGLPPTAQPRGRRGRRRGAGRPGRRGRAASRGRRRRARDPRPPGRRAAGGHRAQHPRGRRPSRPRAAAPADQPRACWSRSTRSGSSCRARSAWPLRGREPADAAPAAPPELELVERAAGRARPARHHRRARAAAPGRAAGRDVDGASRRRSCAPAGSACASCAAPPRTWGSTSRRRRSSSRSRTPPGCVNSTNGNEPVFLPSGEYDAWRARDTAAALADAGLGLAGA